MMNTADQMVTIVSSAYLSEPVMVFHDTPSGSVNFKYNGNTVKIYQRAIPPHTDYVQEIASAINSINTVGLNIFIPDSNQIYMSFDGYCLSTNRIYTFTRHSIFCVADAIKMFANDNKNSVVNPYVALGKPYPHIGELHFAVKWFDNGSSEYNSLSVEYLKATSAHLGKVKFDMRHDVLIGEQSTESAAISFAFSFASKGYRMGRLYGVFDVEHRLSDIIQGYDKYFYVMASNRVVNLHDFSLIVYTDRNVKTIIPIPTFYNDWVSDTPFMYNVHGALAFLQEEHCGALGITDSMIITSNVELAELPVLEAQLMATNTDYKKLFFGGVTQIRLRELAQTQTPAWVVKYVNPQTLEPFTNMPAYNPFKGVSMTVCHTKGVYVPFAYGAYLNYGLALPEGDPFLFGNWLAGSKGHEVLAELKQGAETLGLDAAKCFEGEGGLMPYFEPTDGNAGYLLSLLAGWAESEPNGLFVVENRV